MDIQKQVDHFTSLPYETQKDKVLTMLKELKETSEIFANFYDTLSKLQTISVEVLTYMYTSILEIAEDIAQGKTSEANSAINKMQEAIMQIRAREALDMTKEGNPDSLLQQI